MTRNLFNILNRPNYQVAAQEWQDDLAYLKQKFYDERMAYDFVWPNLKVKLRN